MKPQLLIAAAMAVCVVSLAEAQERVHVSVNFMTQPSTDAFEVTTSSSVNRETATVVGRYSVATGNGPDVGVGVRAWRMLTIGLAVTQVSRNTSGQIHGSYPHPFFFSRPREVDVAAPGGTRTERAAHLSAAVTLAPNRHVTAILFGGPTFFHLTQPVSATLNVAEVYPYDTITRATAVGGSVSTSITGFHAGADIAWYFTRHVGVGGVVRVSQGRRDVTTGTSGPFTLKAGGVQAGGGLRLRF